MNELKYKDLKNIIIRKNKNGDDKFVVQIRLFGNRHPSKTFKSYKEAIAYRNRCELEAYHQTNPVAKADTSEPFRKTVIFYLENLSKIRRKIVSQTSEAGRLHQILKNEKKLCNLATAKMRDVDINDFIKKRLKQVKPDTVIRELTLLKGIFKYSMRRLRINDSPFDSPHIDRPASSEPRSRVLSPIERNQLIIHCRKSKSPWIAYAIEFLLETGMRRGELVSMKYNDVKFYNEDNATVLIHDVKNSRKPSEIINKEVPLSKRATEIIRVLQKTAQSEHVFPIRADALTRMFIRIIKKLNLQDFRLHDLRHERITSLANNGTPIHIIQKITGHRDIKSIMRYINPDNQIAFEYLNKTPPQITVSE